MKQLMAFFNKECMEFTRSGKILLLTIVFVLFGIMNPAIAKLTPWIMEMASESLADTGLQITQVEVDALTSWVQFYKNVPIAMIVFLLMFSGILTAEYQKGTLINMVTKGMVRWKIILAKTCIMVMAWTVLYWLCFGITYGYTAYFWDNGIVENMFFSAGCIYVLGIWLISLVMCMSAVVSTGLSAVLLTGAVFGICYLASMLSAIKEYLPVQLVSAGELLTGVGTIGDYGVAIRVCCIWSVVNIMAAVLLFNKRNI